MLDLNPDSVLQIAEKAREFQSEDLLTLEDDTAASPDDAVEAAAQWHGDPAYLDLKQAIEDLEPDQQSTLVALMWLGRGDYALDEWAYALEYAAEVQDEATADYLIATPLLADYLLEGLNQHGYDED